MGSTDGIVVGANKVLDNGPDNERYNIVLLAEGFTAAEQTSFNARCQEFAVYLSQHPDFSPVIDAINLHRINIASNESGAKDPVSCGGTGADPATYLDATFCADGVDSRDLQINVELALDTLTEQLPLWHSAIALVNHTKDGGTGYQVAAVSLEEDWKETCVHELGHSAFGLADEYDYDSGPGEDGADVEQFTGNEPIEPNVTTVRDRAQLKWGYLVAPHIPIPTQINTDCTTVASGQNPLSQNDLQAIGLFEGAYHHHCGVYRPAFDCIMRDGKNGRFCKVCRDVIHLQLRQFLPQLPQLAVVPQTISFGNVAPGLLVTRSFELINAGFEAVSGVTLQSTNPNVQVTQPPQSVNGGESIEVQLTLQAPLDPGSIGGSIVVSADNHPDLELALGVTICEPLTIAEMVVDEAYVSDLDFGVVNPGLSMYRKFSIRTYPLVTDDGCSAPVTVTLSELLPPFSYAQIPSDAIADVDGNIVFVIPAMSQESPTVDSGGILKQERSVYIGFSAPAETGEFLQDIQIRTDATEEDNLDDPLSLSAFVAAPKPIDAVLVLDRSGSMGAPANPENPELSNKDVVVDAATLFVDLMSYNHRISIVRYNDDSLDPEDVLSPLTAELGDADSGIRNQVLASMSSDALQPLGNTAIGQGMLNGARQLIDGYNESRIMVVLTDGKQNTGIGINQARNEILNQQPVPSLYAVGIGLDRYQQELQAITSTTNGVAHVTGELSGQREFLLQKLYSQIITDATNGALIKDPTLKLHPGNRRATTVLIGSADLEVDFIVLIRKSAGQPKYMRIWVQRPDGTVISESNIHALSPNAQLTSRDGHAVLSVKRQTGKSWKGTWKVWVENFAQSGSRINLVYSIIASSKQTNLQFKGRMLQSSFEPGSSMVALFEPFLGSQRVNMKEPSTAVLLRPDGIQQTLALEQTASGAYQAKIEDTSLIGAYLVTAQTLIVLPDGEVVPRFRQITGVIMIAEKDESKDEACNCNKSVRVIRSQTKTKGSYQLVTRRQSQKPYDPRGRWRQSFQAAIKQCKNC